MKFLPLSLWEGETMYIYIWLYRADDIRTSISTHPRSLVQTSGRSLSILTCALGVSVQMAWVKQGNWRGAGRAEMTTETGKLYSCSLCTVGNTSSTNSYGIWCLLTLTHHFVSPVAQKNLCIGYFMQATQATDQWQAVHLQVCVTRIHYILTSMFWL